MTAEAHRFHVRERQAPSNSARRRSSRPIEWRGPIEATAQSIHRETVESAFALLRLEAGLGAVGDLATVVPRSTEQGALVVVDVAELNAVLLDLTPPEFCFHMTVEEMAAADTTVFIARDGGRAVACGALRRHESRVGEVKRMYTRASHRGRRIGAEIVSRIETLARGEGLSRLVLETGDRHPAAWTVYERAGFTRCGPVLDYPDSAWSVFYEKNLTA